jgi:hypothetical protein
MCLSHNVFKGVTDITLTNKFKIAMALLEIPVSGCANMNHEYSGGIKDLFI